MKVFFIASIAGKKDFLASYEKIIEILESKRCKVISDHVIKDSCDMKDLKLRKEYQKYSKKIHKLINESDAVVAEISYPSIMVGYLLSYFLRQRKYVLCLYQKNPHRILIGDSSRLLRLKKYNPNQPKRLIEIIQKFLYEAKENSLHIRFNLMLDDMTNRQLDQQAKRNGVSKADFIRKLIEENISVS